MKNRSKWEASSLVEIARNYKQRGWAVIPIPYGVKGPRTDKWQQQNLSLEELEKTFRNGPMNIGVQLGPKSGGLADADLDCLEAEQLAPYFLLATGAIFGRKSKPKAHYLYYVADAEPENVLVWNDPSGKRICELRCGISGGIQTMFPGSKHPEGEMVTWMQDGEPSRAAFSTLKQAMIKIAAGSLLLRAWPAAGLKARHEAACRCGGFLARCGFGTPEEIGEFVETISHVTGDDREVNDRRRAAEDAAQAHADGRHSYGLPAMREYFGEDVANKLAEILGYRETADLNAELEKMNEQYCIVDIEGKVRVMTFKEREGRLVAVFYRFDDLRSLLNHKKTQVGKKQIGLASWWIDHADRRQYEGLVFKPGAPSVINEHLNLWRTWGVQPREGDWQLLREHIQKVLAKGDPDAFDYIIRWTAWSLQNPNQRAEVALVFRGGRGVGKSLFGRAMCKIFGQHGVHIYSREHFVGRFNAHMMDCALLFADEAYWPGDKAAESVIKASTTEPYLMIEKKGIDVFSVLNTLKIIMAANADWVVPAALDERRFAVFDVSEEFKEDKTYFKSLHAEMEAGGLAAMMHELLNMDLKDWHPRQDVPKTAALREQQLRSLEPLDQWWLALLEQGYLPGTDGKHLSRARTAELAQHARETVPRLRDISTVALGMHLSKRGCYRCRVNKERGWLFPDLVEARETWSAKLPTEWDEQKEWELEPV
jgi:Family of unknown function (DUF5906)/Bifunctional DNA primase/polymerase, N-terminal